MSRISTARLKAISAGVCIIRFSAEAPYMPVAKDRNQSGLSQEAFNEICREVPVQVMRWACSNP